MRIAKAKSKTEPIKSQVRATFASIAPPLTLPTPGTKKGECPLCDRRHFFGGFRVGPRDTLLKKRAAIQRPKVGGNAPMTVRAHNRAVYPPRRCDHRHSGRHGSSSQHRNSLALSCQRATDYLVPIQIKTKRPPQKGTPSPVRNMGRGSGVCCLNLGF